MNRDNAKVTPPDAPAMVRRFATVRGLPKLVRFLAGHALLGAGVGLLVAVALLWLDVGGLGTLFAGERSMIALIILYFGSFILTFASAAMGTAVMLLPKDEDSFPRG